MKQRKKTLIAAFVIILFVTSVILYSILPGKDGAGSDNPIATPQISSHQSRVFIKDLHKITDEETRRSVEQTLYLHLDQDTSDLYTGTIRDESYSKNIDGNNQTIINFLVDIKPLDITYIVTLVSYQGVYSVNARCASEYQQLAQPNACRDIFYL